MELLTCASSRRFLVISSKSWPATAINPTVDIDDTILIFTTSILASCLWTIKQFHFNLQICRLNVILNLYFWYLFTDKEIRSLRGLTWGSESSADSALPGILSTIAPSNAVSCLLFSPSSIGLPIEGLFDGLSPAYK